MAKTSRSFASADPTCGRRPPAVTCLVTGATGIVGREALAEVRKRPGWLAVGVSARGHEAEGIVGWQMGVTPPPQCLTDIDWDVVIHAAADTRWNRPPSEARRANVASTEALAHVVGPATRLVHLSTAYAAGRRDDGQSPELDAYRNTYEWSKAAAERHVASTFDDAVIIRTPLLVGRRRDGGIARFNGLYSLLTSLTAGHLAVMVATPASPMDIVPVDDLVQLIVGCATDREVIGRVSIGCGPHVLTVGEVVAESIEVLNAWRAGRGVSGIDPPPFVDPATWARFHLPFIRPHLTPSQDNLVTLLQEFQAYLSLPGELPADIVVPDPRPAVRQSVQWWADARPRVAGRRPAPWRLQGDDDRSVDVAI